MEEVKSHVTSYLAAVPGLMAILVTDRCSDTVTDRCTDTASDRCSDTGH